MLAKMDYGLIVDAGILLTAYEDVKNFVSSPI